MPELARCSSSGISYLTDERLFESSGIRIAFTSREGGASARPFDSLNLGAHVGDDLDAVLSNRRLAMDALGFPSSGTVILLNQVHGTNIVKVCCRSDEEIEKARQEASSGADGIAVNVADVATMLCFADCMPVCIASAEVAFAAVHAGWRGVYSEILGNAVKTLCEIGENIDPSELNVYIGPHIRPECFEVSEEIAHDFADRFGEGAVPSYRHVDLSFAARKTLLKYGVSEDRICDCGICTVCSSNQFYSYRASGGRCGRHGAIAFKI